VIDESHARMSASMCRPFSDELGELELAVLRCLSRGMTAQMAADANFFALDTVKTHLKGARYRLRAKNTTHACCEAIRRGLIP
jgi:DNA-binding CsgD family transcriptional regulator